MVRESFLTFMRSQTQTGPVGKNIHKILDESLLEVQKKFEEELKKHSVEEVYERMGKG